MDYYDVLGIPRGASDDEIKKAFHRLAHKHHPHKGGDEKKFKEINEAYQVLSDKTKRSQYDQFGQTFGGAQGGPGAGGFDFSGFSAKGGSASGWDFGNFGGGFEGSDFEDVFSNIFGGGRARPGRRRGADIQVDIEIDFSEMVSGTEKEINLRKRTICDKCQGTGADAGSGIKTCPTCKGAGQIRHTTKSFFGTFSQVSACPECQGEGKVYEKKCSKCGGDGRVKADERIKVAIPAGIEDGGTMSIRQAGEAGEKGAVPGDLYIAVHVRPHPKFQRSGQDILSTEHITFSKAALGGEKEVEIISGSLTIKIPAGTQSGEVFRIKEKGIPSMSSRARGHHLVKIIVDIPKKLSKEQKRLIEELDREF